MTQVQLTNGRVVESGCWISGWWGQYGPDRLIQIADGLGVVDFDTDDRLIAQMAYGRLTDMGTLGNSFETAAEIYVAHYNATHVDEIDIDHPVLYEFIIELSQAVEDDLNNAVVLNADDEPVASFGWWDGEFWLMTADEWEEAC